MRERKMRFREGETCEYCGGPPLEKRVALHRKVDLLLGLMMISWLCSPLTHAKEENWPQWQGPDRDSISPDKGLCSRWPRGGPPGLWKASGIGIGYSSVAVWDQMVYVTGDIGDDLVITAFDLKGKVKWKTVHDKAWKSDQYPGSRSTPTIDEGKLYLLSAHGLVGCYDAKEGSKIWTLSITEKFDSRVAEFGFSESLLVFNDLLIVTPGGKNCVVALNKSTGETVWISSGVKEGANFSSCIAFEYEGIPMIATMTSKSMICLNAKNGELLWQTDRVAQTTKAVCATPLYADGYVFGATGYGNGGVCMKLGVSGEKVTAEQAWDTKDMDNHHGGYVLVDGYIYGANRDGWACINFKTGKTMWKDKGVGNGSICYADKMLYTFSEKNGRMGLVAATPKRFIMAGEFTVPGEGKSCAHPVVIGGRLYLRYGDNLYVFRVKRSG